MKTVILLIAAALAACNSVHSTGNKSTASAASPSPVVQTGDGVRRVTTTELAELMKQGKVIVLDVRTKDAYERGHIRGAKSLPINEVGERGKELPRDKMIVTYCS
jgi:3-mercaptopyruvate sulfurtransferase SseA